MKLGIRRQILQDGGFPQAGPLVTLQRLQAPIESAEGLRQRPEDIPIGGDDDLNELLFRQLEALLLETLDRARRESACPVEILLGQPRSFTPERDLGPKIDWLHARIVVFESSGGQ
ncbi:MAG TPA: hypothetical protein VF179_16110 [Thermoanaerobaculia bacterium]|nr:hypothetical protein [Thermoanaerobaculia bacterium]